MVFLLYKYKCNFPGCDYKTNDRRLIDLHHVVPKEVDSSLTNKRTISFCKTHHSYIFVPESKYGQHSKKSNESLIIKGVLGSTTGNVIMFEDMNGKEILYVMNTGEILNGH